MDFFSFPFISAYFLPFRGFSTEEGAETAEFVGGLTGVVESIDGDQGAVPREKGLDHFVLFGNGVFVAALFQVFMDRHEGGEPESGGGHSQINEWVSGGGCWSATATVHWRLYSSANRRTRRMAK